MKRTVPRLEGAARRAARGEFIGRRIEVVSARDAGLVGLQGHVVDETMRTFVVRRPDGREIRIGKVGCFFEVETPQGPVRLPGEAIEYRSHERTKKVR